LTELPVFAVRARLLEALAEAPVVLSSPTGSGKSTEVPRWLEGRVLVVEPRRIACRSLAARVAELEGTRVGQAVGYVVRDEHVAGEGTKLVFATPGIVLRSDAMVERADCIVLDEFHERSLDVDLLLALLLKRGKKKLVVMSATLEGARVASHVGGAHVTAEGRMFPVDVRYAGKGDELPDVADLPSRVRRAVDAAAREAGDILVFLPGKAEIDASLDALRGLPFALLPLHGGLTKDEQQRVFAPTQPARKVILATNVAETSLTIPGVGVVIDAGLVRQTRYHDGRGALALGPIAEDSASQRAGRAGRTGPGVCVRLWSAAARLEKLTLPEIHRESLVPLVLAAAAWGSRPEDLPLLDPPKPYALEAARADLEAWGALDRDAALTPAGRGIFALPIDARHARLLLEARAAGCLDEAIDLVSVLSVGRPLFLPGPPPEDAHDDLRLGGCDVTAFVRAVREGRPDVHRVSGFVLAEARRIRGRLRRLQGLDDASAEDFDRDALLRAAIAADPRAVHVVRTRGRSVTFSNGGTEVELARESAVKNVRDLEAVVVFDSRAFGAGRETRILITCAAAIPLAWIARAGLGRDRLESVRLEKGRVLATIERVYAKRVIATRDEVPTGTVACEAIAQLFLRGSLFRDSLVATKERLAMTRLAAQLGLVPATEGVDLEAWVAARVASLGVTSGDELALLSAKDFLAPDVPYEVRAVLERNYPRTVSVGDATYEADYDLGKKQVLLRMVRGSRRDPPPLAYLPRFEGLRVCVESPRGIAVLRQR